MKICVVIVTYGNRFHLLEKPLLFFENGRAHRIIVIDNGSSKESKEKLNNYIKSSKTSIQVFDIGYNSGSAKGFKTGIEKALLTDCEHFLLLDDDNLPQDNSMDELLKYWKKLVNPLQYSSTALLANRFDRVNFKKVLKSRNPMHMIQRENNYLGFHWKDIFSKIKERWFTQKKHVATDIDYVKVVAAPYSGLFFHRDLVTAIGLPDEKYVLYLDDFDFSMRISKKGGNIWLIANSFIKDLESSVYLPTRKKILYHSIFEGKDAQMYYSFRNMLYFGKRFLLKNQLVYFINKISFWAIITIMAILSGNLSKLETLRQATKDAENNNMGPNVKYTLH